jgi:hypothetical protein
MEKKYFDLNKLNTTALALLFLAAAPAQFAYGMDNNNNTTEHSHSVSLKPKTQIAQEENIIAEETTLPQVTLKTLNEALPKLEYEIDDKQVSSSNLSEEKKENSPSPEENKKDIIEPKKENINSSELSKNTEQNNVTITKNIIIKDDQVDELTQSEKSKNVEKQYYNTLNLEVNKNFISENLFNKNTYVGKSTKEKCEQGNLLKKNF